MHFTTKVYKTYIKYVIWWMTIFTTFLRNIVELIKFCSFAKSTDIKCLMTELSKTLASVHNR